MTKKQSNSEIYDKIFELKWAEPFKPFALKTADGQRFVIARRDSIGSPNRRLIAFYANGEGGFHEVPTTQITAVSLVRSRKHLSPRARGSSRR
jgi:hypothetical protein